MFLSNLILLPKTRSYKCTLGVFLFFFFLILKNSANAQSYTWASENVTNSRAINLPQIASFQVFKLKTAALLNWTEQREQSSDLLHLRLPGLDTLDIILYKRALLSSNYTATIETADGVMHEPGPSRCMTFTGHLANHPDQNVQLTINDDFIFGSIETPHGELFIEPLSDLVRDAEPQTYIVYHTAQVHSENIHCGYSEIQAKTREITAQAAGNRNAADCYHIEIAIASSYEMYTRYGNTTTVQNHNIGVMNGVEPLYNANPTTPLVQDISFLITTQYIPTVAGNSLDNTLTASVDAAVLLSNFASWGNAGNFSAAYDIATCWLTRDIHLSNDYLVTGYANMGMVCSPGYHVLEDFGGSNPTGTGYGLKVLTAHEIGHNFNCPHDLSAGNIMAAVGSNTTTWSSGSVTTMSNHLLSRTCLPRCGANFGATALQAKEGSSGGTLPAGGSTCGMKYELFQVPVVWSGNPASAPTVTVTSTGGTAVLGKDYDILNTFIVFSTTGATTQTGYIDLRIYFDYIDEGNETINLSLSATNNTGMVTQTTITIGNDCGRYPVNNFSDVKTVISGTVNGLPIPFKGDESDARCMYLVQASELTAQGFLPEDCLVAMALELSSKTSGTNSYQNFTISIKHSNATIGTAVFDVSGGFQTVFTGNYTTVLGWTQIPFQNSFKWNGTQNILIQICYDNTLAIGLDKVKSLASGWTTYKTALAGSGCTLVPNPTYNIYNYRPNTKLYKGFDISTAQNSTGTAYVRNGSETHFYTSSAQYLLSIKQTSGTDAGCVTVTLDRAGNGQQSPTWLPSGNYLSDKTYLITAANPSVGAEISLYYSPAELAVWGGTSTNLHMLKSSGPIASANLSNVTLNETVTTTSYGPTGSTYLAYRSAFSGLAGITITNASSAIFPVDWLEFTVEKSGKDALLAWQVAAEFHNTGFEIQRSSDGRNFTKIGWVPANKQEIDGAYTFLDDRCQLPGVTELYYRLVQIDADGSRNNSVIRVLELDDNALSVAIWPNPGTDDLHISIGHNATSGICSIQVFDAMGKMVWEQEKMVETAGAEMVLATESLPSGLYAVQVKTGAEQKSLTWVKR